MKWIGQHIWDFISRFRSDVYLEDLTESAQDHVVGVDADGKLYKQDVSAGDITGVTAGDALTGGGTSGAVTINHEDTSSQASVDNSGSTYIQDVTLDTYGHVTGLTSAAVPTLNQDTTGQAGTVATIAGLAPNTATTQAAQPNITTMTGFVTGSANQLLTDDGDGTVTSESGLTFSGTALASTAALHTQINSIVATSMIQNTGNNSLGGQLTLSGNRAGADAQDDDVLGTILFSGLDDGTPSAQSYGQIQTKVADATSGQEAGKMEFTVAEFDGTNTTVGLLIDGDTNANGEINVTIGAGSACTTTINGKIALGHATDTILARQSAGVVTVENKTVALGTELAGHNDNVIIKQVKVTLSQSDVNSLHTTPVNLVSAQGANTIIVFMQAIMRVTHAANQTNAACDMAFHYDGQEPGVNFSESVMFLRRFNNGESGDRTYNLMAITNGHIAQNLTDPVNKALEVSLDSAATNNCTNGIDIWLTYYVIDIS